MTWQDALTTFTIVAAAIFIAFRVVSPLFSRSGGCETGCVGCPSHSNSGSPQSLVQLGDGGLMSPLENQ